MFGICPPVNYSKVMANEEINDMPDQKIDFDAINKGFSKEAEIYESDEETNPIIRWARVLVRQTVTQHIPAGGTILEINAGTGIDAAWLVGQGYTVHATDIADGMLSAARKKAGAAKFGEKFTVQKLSFTELEQAEHAPFDGVFSNFGGLNCVADLSLVARGLKKVLKPGGKIVWVVMPPICPWEMVQSLRGEWRRAFRRLQRGGVLANVSGTQIMTYYFSPRQVQKALGSDFKIEALQSFSLFCPPMNMTGLPGRFPALTRVLMRMDEYFGRLPFFRGMGDFFIVTARYIER